MHILVTGGAGFLGSHLCEALHQRGHDIICVDNLLTSKKQNIAHLLDEDRFTFINHDIIEPLYIDEQIDHVYNLACPASPVHYQKNAIRTVKANTIGMINVLGLAKKHGARIFQASTSEVYGDPQTHPQAEDYNGNVSTTGPRACYDEGKRVAETLCFDYHRAHGVEIRVARIFNTYGPRMALDDGRVVSNFATQALRNDPITIYGDGSQTRSFCYVDDLIDGFIKLMNSEETGPINLGNPHETTIKELAQTIIDLIGTDSELIYKRLPKDDPTRRKPDITKAQEKLGWQPAISLEQGLKNTIDYFKTQLS